MFKIKFTAILGSVAILFSSLTTPLMAGSLGIGITGIGAHLETTGTETLKTTSVKTSAQEDEQAAAVAGYVQYRFGDNGFVIGIDYMPGETSLGSSTTTKVDKLKSGDVTVVQSAKAVLTNHVTPYIETPALGPMGLFFKVGYAHAGAGKSCHRSVAKNMEEPVGAQDFSAADKDPGHGYLFAGPSLQ